MQKLNQNEISEIVKKTTPKWFSIKKCFGAFWVGGSICLFAEIINQILDNYLSYEIASALTITIMVFLGSLLTGLGIYDKISRYGYSGSIIPITGFANSMTSSSLESKNEGLFLGILPSMFKLAGSAIAVGVISSFVISTILYALGWY